MKSSKSLAEVNIEENLVYIGKLIQNQSVKISDAEKLEYLGFKVLHKCEELRKSRDNWRKKYEDLLKVKN